MERDEILAKSRAENKSRDVYEKKRGFEAGRQLRTGAFEISCVSSGGNGMNKQLILQHRLKEAQGERKLSQGQLAGLVKVSRNTISSTETGQFNPTAKLALILCIA